MQIIQTHFNYTKELIPLDLSKVEYLVIHHTEAVTASPEEIHSWHLKNGWNGFGYNEYIRKDGTVYIGRGDNVGAQTLGYNSVSYGICCEGNFDMEEKVPETMLNSLYQRIRYNAGRIEGIKYIVPHGKLFATSCPGKFFPMKTVEDVFNNFIGFKVAVISLANKGIINSPNYWLNNCFSGKTVDGEFVQVFFKKVAEKLNNNAM